MYSPDEDYRNIEVKPDLGLTDDNKNIKMIGQRIRKIRKREYYIRRIRQTILSYS